MENNYFNYYHVAGVWRHMTDGGLNESRRFASLLESIPYAFY